MAAADVERAFESPIVSVLYDLNSAFDLKRQTSLKAFVNKKCVLAHSKLRPLATPLEKQI